MAKDEDSKIDFSDDLDFPDSIKKGLNITKAQLGNMKLKANSDENLLERIRKNIKNIRKHRRRNRRR